MKKVRQGGAMSLLLLGGVLSPSSAELITSPPYMLEMDDGVMVVDDEGLSGVEQAPMQDTPEINPVLSEMMIEST